MKNRTLILAVVLWGLMPAWSGRLSSQPLADYRLSQDRFDYALPADIRIQAAGEIGSARLVVWGTRIDNGQGEPEHALVLNLNGVQRVLTSPESRPYGAVGVVPLEDRFLVVWNDRRSGEAGIWCRTVLTSGEFGGQEHLLITGGKITAEVYWWSGPTHAWMFWDDDRTGAVETRAARITTRGDLIGSDTLLGEGRIVPAETERSAEGALIIGRGNDRGFFIDANGELHPSAIPAGRLLNPQRIEADGSLIVLESGMLRQYASVTAAIPDWSILVPESDLGLPPRLVGRDSIGWFVLSQQMSKAYVQGGMGYWLDLVKRYVGSDVRIDGRKDTVHLSFLGFPTSSVYSGRLEISDVTHWRYNQVLVALRGIARFDANGSFEDSVEKSVSYILDLSGAVRVPPDFSDLLPLVADHRVERSASDTLSRVAAIFFPQRDTVLVAAPIAPVPVSCPDSRPNLMVADDKLCLTWVQDSLALRRATYGMFSEPLVDSGSVAGAFRPLTIFWPQLWGGAAYTHVSVSSFGHKEFPDGNEVWNTTSVCRAWIPFSTGWRDVAVDRRSLVAAGPAPMKFAGQTWDPNSSVRTFVTLLPHSSLLRSPAMFYGIGVAENDSVPTARWNFSSSVEEVLGYIPVSDSSGFVAFANDTLGYLVPGESMSFTLLPSFPKTNSIRFQRLLGDRFLRYGYSPQLGKLVLEVNDLHPQMLKRVEMPMPDQTIPFLLQNPSDSSIVLLWGSDQGVRCAYFSKDLERMVEEATVTPLVDFRVSATTDSVAYPCGIFRNDTLFVAWEDYRDGAESDIYGTWWPVPEKLRVVGDDVITDTTTTPPQVPGPGEPLVTGVRILSARPNPAMGDVGVTVESAEGGIGHLLLYDGLGRRVVDREVVLKQGVGTYVLDVSQIPSGGYFLRIDSGTSVAEERLVIWGP